MVLLDSPHFSLGFSFKFESVSVVDESVENGICECGIGDPCVPVFERQLSGDESRPLLVTVVEDLEKIPFGLRFEWCYAPIIQNEQVDFLQ